MRRINQRYLLATSTKLDISKVNIGETINDAYFRRVKAETRYITTSPKIDCCGNLNTGLVSFSNAPKFSSC